MILTDGCHLVSDVSLQELHRFAGVIGMPGKWFQDRRHPHYDLLGAFPLRAFHHGAHVVTTRELVKRAIRKERTPA